MKAKLLIAAIIFSFGININYLNAQCSDAGICQLGLHFDEPDSKKLNLGVSYNFGYSGKEDDIQYHTVQLDASYQFHERTSVAILLPYNAQSGSLGNVSGIGDLIIGASHELQFDQESGIALSLGARLATGDENKDPELPQKYQSSLGSNDILLGLQYYMNSLYLSAGYQIAGERNNNEITRLKRGDDLLIRGGYQIAVNDFTFDPQLLIIKRLSESSVLDPSSSSLEDEFMDVEDSDQLQINFLLNTQYALSDQSALFFEFAFPFLKREVNVDGLTRALTVALGVNLRL
jgi:predicted porin